VLAAGIAPSRNFLSPLLLNTRKKQEHGGIAIVGTPQKSESLALAQEFGGTPYCSPPQELSVTRSAFLEVTKIGNASGGSGNIRVLRQVSEAKDISVPDLCQESNGHDQFRWSPPEAPTKRLVNR
jgi:hypothetical protein